MFKSKKSRPEVQTQERTYSSSEVAQVADVSLRQLQWWDERKVVSPRHEGHRRVYFPAEVIEITEGITRVILRFGFMQYPTISEGLNLACRQGKLKGIDLSDVTYYIGRETIIPREDIPGMWVWRESIFAFLQRNAERTAAFFDVPTGQVVEFGTEIEI